MHIHLFLIKFYQSAAEGLGNHLSSLHLERNDAVSKIAAMGTGIDEYN